MATMKAAQIHEWGGSDVVHVEDIPIPEPKNNEVLIRVHAASINPADWKYREGYMKQYVSLPMILGLDNAGEIVKVGSEVTNFNVGDAVYASTDSGSFAQFVTTPATSVAPKPRTVDYVQAAAIPVAGQTAWQALFNFGHLQPGQKVLIHGAAGGVGSFAVQLAKWKGAYVIGTASAANKDFVLGLGADEFIDYKSTRFEDVVKDADLVLDTVGGETLARSFNVVKPGGTLVTVAGRPSPEEGQAHGIHATGMRRIPDRRESDQFNGLIDQGSIKVIVSEVQPLDHIQQALDQSQSGHTRGKIVIEIP